MIQHYLHPPLLPKLICLLYAIVILYWLRHLWRVHRQAKQFRATRQAFRELCSLRMREIARKISSDD